MNRQMAEHIVNVLNDLLEHDRPAIAALLANRVPCNEALADHPTCCVGVQHGGYHVGMLGVLNAIANYAEGGDQYGPIAGVFDESDDPREDKTLLCFRIVGDEQSKEKG